MKSALSLVVIACLVASTLPVTAQQNTETPAGGPLSRSVTREALRLAAAGQSGAPVNAVGQADVGTKPLELKWSELAPLIAGQRVEVVLADGKTIKGEAIAVRDDALLVDARTAPRGSTAIPRASVTVIRLQRTTGSGGRAIGTVLGVVLGMTVGGAVAFGIADSAGTGVPLYIGLSTAIAVGGYYAGKAADTKTTLITIVP